MSTSRNEWLGNVAHWLTEPVSSVQDPEDRIKSRWLATTMIILFLLGFLIAALPTFLYGQPLWENTDVVVMVGATTLWVVPYVLSRAGRHRLAASIAKSTASLVIFVLAIVGDNMQAFVFLLIPVLIGSTLLSVRVMSFSVVVEVLAIFLVSVWILGANLSEVLTEPLSFFVIGSALILLISRQRDMLEQHRTAALARANRALQQEMDEGKRTEQALRDSEDRFHSVVRTAVDAIITIDSQGVIVAWNRGAEKIFGYAPDEIIGKPSILIMPERIHQEYWGGEQRPFTQRDSATLMQCCVTVGLRKDGHECPIEMSLATWRTTEGRFFTGIIRDITDRVRAGEALRHSELHFRALIENAPDLIVIIDEEAKIRFASPSVERLFGYSAEAFMEKSALDFVHPGDLPSVAAALANAAQQPGSAPSIDVRFRHVDGSWRTLECAATNLIDHPAVSGVVVNARDISERVHAEARVRASLREKEVLLKEIHHRVKNNLQVIASLLSLQSDYLPDAATRQLFEESQHRIRSMALIHERLYQSGDLARIDFVEYVSSLAMNLSHAYRAQARGIRLEVDADATFLDIDTAIPCGLILNELVTNALKHGFPDGHGGSVSIGMRAEAEGRHVIVVQDDGVGFPEAVDFHNTTSLGLQLVNSLVRQLGGTIELCKTGGTKFEITLVEARDGEK